tara:strand:- start:680 stop:3985 length:3306 start_codon:yes stop_codon:yes gene_type:complete
MAISNYDRVGKALTTLKTGLAPFVSREFVNHYKGQARHILQQVVDVPNDEVKPFDKMDAAALLKVMWEYWNDVYREVLGHTERSIVSELREVRNKWAHQEMFSSDDTYRALDSVQRLLTSVVSPLADDISKMKNELLRIQFNEQVRNDRRKTKTMLIDAENTVNLKPWRELIIPHDDVSTGVYQQAEFAADLWQVHKGEGSNEYRDPVEFFNRTYLTKDLRSLLRKGVQRLCGKIGGDPVVQLQTNFGGGKTHSMLAIYHLFSGIDHKQLSGVDSILHDLEVTTLPEVKRVVLVGNKISPGNPDIKTDGTKVRTLWGELAWQLGGAEAYKRIQADDENATNPGKLIEELMNDYGPCLILIDEWVAYVRQLHEENDLPAGNLATHSTFAQSLTESVALVDNCLLLVSLPASEVSQGSDIRADDLEVGGERGKTALDSLSKIVSRVSDPWKPASADEGFEIVRRRLFKDMDPLDSNAKDIVIKAYSELYQVQKDAFPLESQEKAYIERMEASYPFHPELFDRLYQDWSTLPKFQRTRGVLRLMASVINNLWENGDKSPLIMPCNISIDDPKVQNEMLQYLTENWVPIIESDVDGPNALPLKLDREIPNFGKISGTRRIARTIYLGSAPTMAAANTGIDIRRINLGCVIPGEKPSIFGDALRRLTLDATYMYQGDSRYWYSTQATVTKLAADRAHQMNQDKVRDEIEKRIRDDLQVTGEFSRVYPLPQSNIDVPDVTDSGLVVLDPDHSFSKEPDNKAKSISKQILELQGNKPRIYRNSLVFLAADKNRLTDLEEAVKSFLAWESILAEKVDPLDLTQNQVKQAENQKTAMSNTIKTRIPEAYQWLLVPNQSTPDSSIEFQPIQLRTNEPLAMRASKRLLNEDRLISRYGAALLRMELDKVLWRGQNHIAIRQLIDDFASYIYLPRLKDPSVLIACIRDGVALMTWEQDSFAYAETYDQENDRYRGLRKMEQINIVDSDAGILVRSDVARKQLDKEIPEDKKTTEDEVVTGTGNDDGNAESPPTPQKLKRYHGHVKLDPTRAGRDAATIADEVISHLSGLIGSEVKVTLEIEANIPDGVSENIVRTVYENSRTLKFDASDFENE